ncbi:MAG: hypothetical protein ABIM88_03020 [candidate division WOR-3 bacterium]
MYILLSLLGVSGAWGPDCPECGDEISGGPRHGGTGISFYYADTLRGNYVTGDTGLYYVTSGTITISGIPSGATVTKAFLIWTCLMSASNPSITFNGNPITGTLIGTAPTPCRAGDGPAWCYIADVTNRVTGNGVYTVSGFPTRTEGASLIVIYERAADPLRNIVFYTGAYTIEGGLYYRYDWTMTNFRADNPVGYAKITFFFYDGQDIPNGSDCGWEYLYYEAYADSNKQLIAGWDGAYWDDTTFNMTAWTPPGATSIQVGYATDCDNHSQGGCTDCIGTMGAILAVNTPDPTGAEETADAGLIRFGPGYVELLSGTSGTMRAYSPDGRLVLVLGSGELSPGRYDLSRLGPGVYILRLTGERPAMEKVLVR